MKESGEALTGKSPGCSDEVPNISTECDPSVKPKSEEQVTREIKEQIKKPKKKLPTAQELRNKDVAKLNQANLRPERLPGESFADYKKRRAENKQLVTKLSK